MACTRPYCGRCLGGAICQKSPGSRVGLVARLKEATNAIGLLMLAGSPTALSASRRKNSRNEVLGSGTEVCISVDRVAEGARTRIGRLSISRACAARGSDLPCLVLRVYPASCFAPAAPSAPFASSLSRRTISAVSRMSASLSSSPIAEAITRNRAFNSR